jgi:hypothetical protein
MPRRKLRHPNHRHTRKKHCPDTRGGGQKNKTITHTTTKTPLLKSRKLKKIAVSNATLRFKTIIRRDIYNMMELCTRYFTHPDKNPITSTPINDAETSALRDICSTRRIYNVDLLTEIIDDDVYNSLIHFKNQYLLITDTHLNFVAPPKIDNAIIIRYSQKIAEEFARNFRDSATAIAFGDEKSATTLPQI